MHRGRTLEELDSLSATVFMTYLYQLEQAESELQSQGSGQHVNHVKGLWPELEGKRNINPSL